MIVLGFTIILSILITLLSNSKPKQVELTFWGFWEEEEVMHPLIEKYEAAIKEAESILGSEYAMSYGPFFDLVEAARSAKGKHESDAASIF